MQLYTFCPQWSKRIISCFIGFVISSSTVITHQYVPQWSFDTVQVPCLQVLWSNVLFMHNLTLPNFGSLTVHFSKSKCTELMNLTESLVCFFDLNLGYFAFLRKNAVKALSRLLSDCCNASVVHSLSHSWSCCYLNYH